MITLSNVSKQYGSRVLYDGASFQINPSDRIGLVGLNGAGKTTLFRLILGEEAPDKGAVTRPTKTKLAYFSQNVAEMAGRTALEEVRSAAADLIQLREELTSIEKALEDSATSPLPEQQMNRLLERYGEAQEEFQERGGYELESRAKEILTGLGIQPDEHSRMVDHFSGGWKMRIQLAKILIQTPDVLLLDEPTNHLDLESIVWLEEWLKNFKGAIVMTSHDREFMNRLVSRVVEISFGKVSVYSGNYDFYERESQVRKEQQLAAHRRQQDMLAKEEEFIARFAARASHAAQVQSRVKKLEKIERVEIPPEEQAMNFSWPSPQRGGEEVVKFEGLGKTWFREDGKKTAVFSGASALIKRGDRVAVVGINGAGKSTLLKIIAGQTEPTEGRCSVGPSIQIGYFSQNSLDVLNPKKTLFEEVHDRLPNASIGFVRNLLGAFKFSGEEVEKRISVLSGGEKSRLLLAVLLTQAPNCIVLDEPTNHLDIKSREVLLEALVQFPGTVIMVSHDRFFLRKVATRVFEVDQHRVLTFDMTYDEYQERRQRDHQRSH